MDIANVECGASTIASYNMLHLNHCMELSLVAKISDPNGNFTENHL